MVICEFPSLNGVLDGARFGRLSDTRTSPGQDLPTRLPAPLYLAHWYAPRANSWELSLHPDLNLFSALRYVCHCAWASTVLYFFVLAGKKHGATRLLDYPGFYFIDLGYSGMLYYRRRSFANIHFYLTVGFICA